MSSRDEKIAKTQYHKYKKYISEVAEEAAIENLRENREIIFKVYVDEGIYPVDGKLQVDVIYDG